MHAMMCIFAGIRHHQMPVSSTTTPITHHQRRREELGDDCGAASVGIGGLFRQLDKGFLFNTGGPFGDSMFHVKSVSLLDLLTQ
jgi:hypothetical protein